jgi:hypothetical protein
MGQLYSWLFESDALYGNKIVALKRNSAYTAVELRTGVFAGEETPVLNQSEL